MTVTRYINDGLALAARGEYRDAALAFCRAVKQDPASAEAHGRLGEVLIPLGRWEDAGACFCRAVELQPRYPQAYNHLGVVLKNQERLAEAEECFRQAIAQQDDYAEAYHNLGNCLKYAGRFSEAEAAYMQALALKPDLSQSSFALATLYFIQGQYEKGWQLHETRFGQNGKFRLPIPPWQGEDLAGRNILLYYEQGYGDTFQFIRYAYKVADLAAVTAVWLQKPLARLLAATQTAFAVCDDGRTIDSGRYDFACSLYSLPAFFRTTAATIPRDFPYIKAPADLAAKWREKIAPAAAGRYKVGVVWAGNPEHDDDNNRSIPFKAFSRLLADERIFWVSLQVGGRHPHPPGRPRRLYDHTAEFADFAETAGVIDNLDLVIAVDTAVAHLAGAMGKPTWLLLPYRPDWRWGLESADSLWYPRTTLFRQSRPGDWPAVLDKIKAALPAAMATAGAGE